MRAPAKTAAIERRRRLAAMLILGLGSPLLWYLSVTANGAWHIAAGESGGPGPWLRWLNVAIVVLYGCMWWRYVPATGFRARSVAVMLAYAFFALLMPNV